MEEGLASFYYRQARLTLYHNQALGLYSRVGEL